jgi:hypothetical protein
LRVFLTKKVVKGVRGMCYESGAIRTGLLDGR